MWRSAPARSGVTSITTRLTSRRYAASGGRCSPLTCRPPAIRFYNRLLGLGYSQERFAQSIRANNPLHGLKKELRQPFVDSLTEFEKGQLQRAMQFYSRIALSKGKEKELFPSERWPGRQFRPRPDVLRSTIRQQGAMGEADAMDFAQELLEEAVR